MAHIDYYFSLLSSYTYLGVERFHEIAARHGADVTYKPLDFLVAMDRLGVPRPAERSEARKIYRAQDLKRIAHALGKPMRPDPAFWPVNVAPASYAVIAAQEAGGGDLAGLIERLHRAVWEEERDISDDAVITEALKAAGFDPMLSMTGMLKGAEIYAQNLEEALRAGVIGAPFYIVTDTDERFWGQDRLDLLDAHLAGL